MPKKSQVRKVLAGKPLVTKVLRGKEAEKVMVVAREDIFSSGIWHGINSENVDKFVRIINTKHKFLPRSQVETDARWQQIIPFIVFENSGKLFLMQRKAGHTDKRLASKLSLGIGGHINKRDLDSRSARNKSDMNGKSDVMSWAKREFEEEVDYKGNYKAQFLGLINDDTNDVGLVHLGLVVHMIGDSSEISVKDEHRSGQLKSLRELGKVYKNMETWGQIIYDHMTNKNKESRIMNKGKKVESKITGILPDWVIAKYIEQEIIKISGLGAKWKQNIDQVSMDFHLGSSLKLFRGGTYRFVDTKRGLPPDAMEEVNLQEGDPFILEPGAFAIASTKEVLKLPADIIGRLEGKSSLARLGILVHSTAARFDPGWNGAPVLELGNMGPKPAILYCGMAICAFTFEKLSAPVKMKYEGSRSDRYSGSKLAIASRIERHGKR